MTCSVFSTLLLGAAVLALSACGGSKGPGALGSKDDIVVRNNGLPGATAPVPPSAEGEMAQVQSAATPEVAQAPLEMPTESQPIPAADPAMEEAVRKVEEAKSPVAPTTTTPMNDGTTASTAPITETVPADVVAPEPVAQTATLEPAVPVSASTTPDSVPEGTPIAATDNTYVPTDAPASAVSALNAKKMSDYPAAAPAPAPMKQPVPTPQPVASTQATSQSPSSVYPAEDYSPEALAQTQAAVPVSPTPASQPEPMPTINFADPEIVKTVQAALKLKGVYKGKENGVVNTQYLNALSKYQGDNKLPQGGLNLETLRHLAVVQ